MVQEDLAEDYQHLNQGQLVDQELQIKVIMEEVKMVVLLEQVEVELVQLDLLNLEQVLVLE